METSFHGLWVRVFQVILAYESIMLCEYSGKYIDIYFIMKITYYILFILFVSYVRIYTYVRELVTPTGQGFPPSFF